jgi:hypothetical protein
MKEIFYSLLLLSSSVIASNNSYENLKKSKYGFIENKGQIHDQNYQANPAVKYLLPLGNGLNVQLKSNGFSYDTYKINYSGKTTKIGAEEFEDFTTHYHRIDISFVGANTNPQIIAEDAASNYLNFFTATTPKNGATNVKHFGKIIYKDLYPNIDLVFEAKAGSSKPVEYTFVVRPGGDANQIKWKYTGADATELKNNNIVLTVAHGKLSEKIPASWIEESKKAININYTQIENNVFAFNIPAYNKKQTLVIDPTPNLAWGTYFGSDGEERGFGITSDANNNVYVIGTAAGNFLATSGAHQTIVSGTYDAIVSKFNSNGVQQWGTYYGGTSQETGRGIQVDANGNIYVTGNSSSNDGISTTGAHQTIRGGSNDAYLAKFTNAGVLVWGTYYGGSSIDNSFSVSLVNGFLYIAGETLSTTNISTTGAYQTAFGGGSVSDGFIAKFDTNGVRQWGTYFGGAGNDNIWSVSANNSGVVFTGYTETTTGFGIGSPHQSSYGGSRDAFVAKLTAAGAIVWSTYYGGTSPDEGRGITMDASGNVYVVGNSQSSSLIASEGSYQETKGLGMDAFIVKFNSDGEQIWGTYFGAEGSESGNAIVLDASANVYIAGYSSSASAMASSNSHQTTHAGNTDAIVAKFSTNGLRQWGTYYGGTGTENGNGIALDANNNVLFIGETPSTSGIATSGAHQTTNAGGFRDAVIAKFSTCSANTATANITSCFSYTSPSGNYTWTSGGAYLDTIPNTAGCDSVITINLTINTVNNNITVNNGTFTANQAGATYQWVDCNNNYSPISGATAQSFNPTVNGNYAVIVTLNNCSDTSNCAAINNVGIKEIENNSIAVYPNPANNRLNIELLSEAEIEIYSLTGVLMDKFSAKQNHIVDVSGYPNGMYFVKTQNQTIKFVKQ